MESFRWIFHLKNIFKWSTISSLISSFQAFETTDINFAMLQRYWTTHCYMIKKFEFPLIKIILEPSYTTDCNLLLPSCQTTIWIIKNHNRFIATFRRHRRPRHHHRSRLAKIILCPGDKISLPKVTCTAALATSESNLPGNPEDAFDRAKEYWKGCYYEPW